MTTARVAAELATLLTVAAVASLAVSVIIFALWPILQDVALSLGFLVAISVGAA